MELLDVRRGAPNTPRENTRINALQKNDIRPGTTIFPGNGEYHGRKGVES